MKPAARVVLVLLFSFAIAAASACGSSSTSTGSKSSPHASSAGSSSGNGKLDAGVPMPQGFPADFPIYPGARLTSASNFTSGGQTTWAMVWETLDGVDKAQSFYTDKLNSGDWTIGVSGSTNGEFSGIFSRKSDSTVGGILSIDGSTGVTKITVALGHQ